MKNEQEIVRSVFDAYIRDAKAISTKKDRPTFDMLEEVKNRAIKALDQQLCEDCVSRTQAIEWIENLRQMDKCFGNYEDDYFPLSEVIDRLKNVPPATPTIPTSKDCVSIAELEKWLDLNFSFGGACRKLELFERLEKELPRVTPTHGTCKDCRHREGIDLDASFCAKHGNSARNDFYCADYEKRGSENEVD